MSDLLKQANHILLEPVNLTERSLESIIGKAMSRGIDEADVFLQSCSRESWFLEDGIVKSGSFDIDRGFGLRVISGEKTGFAYIDEINLKSLEKAAGLAKNIVQDGGQRIVRLNNENPMPALYPTDNPLASLAATDKVALLQDIHQQVIAKDARVKQVMVSLSGSYNTILYLHSDGCLSADVRPLVSLHLRVIVENKGCLEQGTAGGGGRCGYEFFNEKIIDAYVDKAVRQAVLGLDAKPAPAGTFPVVLGPGWPAILLHEAIGHGLEGDFNRKGSSAFSGKIGQRVATDLCTVVDDGSIPGRRGSLTVDDEGIQTQKTVLIEKGILKNYMQDRHNAKLMGMAPTGNGRRESYACLPLPRMTNTYMYPGKSKPDEIIASVKKGIYAVDFSGGQVDITSGKFVFSASEAYLIENGKVTQPVKGVTLIGNGPDVLTKVSMVADDLKLDSGIGTCGKDGQSVPVGVGQPTLKIDALTVGGQTQA